MGRQVTVTLVCDVCKKNIDEKTSISGELAANRKRFNLQFHKTCLDGLTSAAEVSPRKKRGPGRPKGSKNKPKAAVK